MRLKQWEQSQCIKILKPPDGRVSALFIFSLSALIELDKQFVCVKVGNWFMKDAYCDELTLVNQDAIFIYFILFTGWRIGDYVNGQTLSMHD